jgi:periplasmic protein TonB
MAHSVSHPLSEAGFVSPALSQRSALFAGIVAFHVVLVYLLASGLAVKTVKVVFEPLIADVVDKPQVDQPPPPPPPVELTQPRDFDPGPVPDVNVPVDSGPGVITTPPVVTPTITEAPPRVEPIHLVGKHQLPNTEDYYPPSIIRDGVQGATIINVCVDERGKRTGDPTVVESSGSAGLDKAAIAIGRDGRYARSARGETFVPNCYPFKIVFKIQPR